MNRSRQRGNTEIWLLFSLVMAGIALFMMFQGELEAPAEDVTALVSLTEPVPEAKSKLREFLQETPHPTRNELGRFKSDINAIIVNNTVKSVTGVAPTQTSPKRTTWDEHPLTVFIFGNWKLLLGAGVFTLILLHPSTRLMWTMLFRDLAKLVSKVRAKRV